MSEVGDKRRGTLIRQSGFVPTYPVRSLKSAGAVEGRRGGGHGIRLRHLRDLKRI